MGARAQPPAASLKRARRPRYYFYFAGGRRTRGPRYFPLLLHAPFRFLSGGKSHPPLLFASLSRSDMPSLKSLSLRLRSVTSTAKITKAMKMVAASKLRGAETKMKAARPFASSINELFATYLEPKEDDAPETKALLAVSSDKGLCGGINSRVVKEIKRIYDEEPAVEPKVRTTHTFTQEGPLRDSAYY